MGSVFYSMLYFFVYIVNDLVCSVGMLISFDGLFYFSDIIFFIPNSLYLSLPSELYLAVERSESKLFLKVFFLFDIYRAFLNSIPEEFFLFKEPGLVFFAVSYK